MTALSIIEKFVHSIDSTIEVGFNHNFCADISEYKIYIEDYEHPIEDKLIQNFIKEQFGIIIHPFLIGILHEIGHLMTYEAELDEQRTIMYALLAYIYDETQYEQYSEVYFKIPAELAATTWAVEYYKNNTKHCEHFLDELFMR